MLNNQILEAINANLQDSLSIKDFYLHEGEEGKEMQSYYVPFLKNECKGKTNLRSIESLCCIA